MTTWGIAFPLTRKLGLLMARPLTVLEGLDSDDPRVQDMRALVLQGGLITPRLGPLPTTIQAARRHWLGTHLSPPREAGSSLRTSLVPTSDQCASSRAA